jgi:von Willebrand factor type A domain
MSSSIKIQQRALPGLALSLMLHAVAALVMAFVHVAQNADDLRLAVESIFEVERPTEEFTKEMNSDTEIAETFNFVAGGNVSAAASGGTGAPAVAQTKIDQSEQFRDPTVVLNIGEVTLPGIEQLGRDLGESQIAGEPTAPAEGYGEALGRITQELLRMLRDDKLTVAWLFDESESMKDDQQEIRDQFHKVYEELGLVIPKDPKIKAEKDILLSAIFGFGDKLTQITSKPTGDIPEIRAAIDKVGIDPTGKEHMCAAIDKVLDEYKTHVTRGRRKLVLIVVTDESGDDGQGALIDEVVRKARQLRAPVYILGRESLFGYKFGRIAWVDPKYGLTHWLGIHRGPETAYEEALQYDGLHDRWDSHPSGFAPYEQARLSKETGGIFFVLPSEEQNLVGQAAAEKRKFAFLDLKEYVPELLKRREYEELRQKSKFRSVVWETVKLLDPRRDEQLNIQEGWYSTDPTIFKSQGQQSFNRALRAMGLLNQAAKALEKAEPLRDKEESQRWRANYDLAYAQVLAYRVRLFQVLLALDAHINSLPRPKNAMNNVWGFARIHDMQAPTERQVKLTKVDIDELRQQLDLAKSKFEFVKKSHPRTPWANRAEYEMNIGFGVKFVEGFRDPRYDKVNALDIKIPSL